MPIKPSTQHESSQRESTEETRQHRADRVGCVAKSVSKQASENGFKDQAGSIGKKKQDLEDRCRAVSLTNQFFIHVHLGSHAGGLLLEKGKGIFSHENHFRRTAS